MPARPKKPPAEWEAQKERIHTYYIVERRNLRDTMDLMRTNHNFEATKKEYVFRIQSWQMTKNLNKDDWKLVYGRKSAHKQTDILVNGNHIDPRRLKRGMARYRFETGDSFQWPISSSSSRRGITIRTPSPKPSMQLKMERIPWFQFQDKCTCYLLSLVHMLIPQLNWIKSPDDPASSCSPGELSMYNTRSLLGYFLCLNQGYVDNDLTLSILRGVEQMLPCKPASVQQLSSKEPFFMLLQSCIYLSSNWHLSCDDMDHFLNWMLESGCASHLNQFMDDLRSRGGETIEIFLSRLLLSAVSIENESVVCTLLQKGVDPNGQGCQRYTKSSNSMNDNAGFSISGANALQFAILKNGTRISKILLSHGADPNASCDFVPFRPLELAVTIDRGHASIVEMLVDSGADTKVTCDYEVDFSCIIFNELHAGARVEESLLMRAVESQNVDIVRVLLRQGAPVNEVSAFSGTAIQIAIMKNDWDLVDILLQEGAKVDMVDALDDRAIQFLLRHLDHFVARCMSSPYFEGISDYEVDQSVKWEVCSSPIQLAARRNNARLIERLLQEGGAVAYQPDWGKIWARIPQPTDLKTLEFYRYLKQASRERFQTALHESVLNGNIYITRLLLQHGAKDFPNASGTTVLQLACGLEEDDELMMQLPMSIRLDLAQLLLEYGSDVNAAPGPANGRTALQAAAEAGDQKLVELLVENGADINAPPAIEAGLTALEAAARSGKPDLVMFLIESGASLESDAEILWLTLRGAALKGDAQTVEQLLKHDIDVNALYLPQETWVGGKSILQAAVQGGDLVVVRMLLDAGANIDLVANGESALCTAIREDDEVIFNLLLLQGANTSPANCEVTPLAIAAAKCRVGIVQRLLQAGADVNEPSQNPKIQTKIDVAGTPLFWALLRPSYQDWFCNRATHDDDSPPQYLPEDLRLICSMLLSHGADPNAVAACVLGSSDDSWLKKLSRHDGNPNLQGREGVYPIHLAARFGTLECLELLINAGADVDAYDLAGNTAIKQCFLKPKTSEVAVRILIKADADTDGILANVIGYGFSDLAFDLLNDGADVNAPAFDLRTLPLTAAARIGHIDLIRLLLDRGADIDAQTNSSETALHVAAKFGHFSVVRLLLEIGANINARGDYGTALQVAAGNGCLDVVSLLLENDNQVNTIESRCQEAAKFADERGYVYLAKMLHDYRP